MLLVGKVCNDFDMNVTNVFPSDYTIDFNLPAYIESGDVIIRSISWHSNNQSNTTNLLKERTWYAGHGLMCGLRHRGLDSWNSVTGFTNEVDFDATRNLKEYDVVFFANEFKEVKNTIGAIYTLNERVTTDLIGMHEPNLKIGRIRGGSSIFSINLRFAPLDYTYNVLSAPKTTTNFAEGVYISDIEVVIEVV